MENYRARPLSRQTIRNLTTCLRQLFEIPFDKAFPVIEFIEYVLPKFDYTLEICEQNELGNKYALTMPGEKQLKISEKVYINAINNNPRDLFTLAHEIGHVFLHDCNSIVLARSDEDIKAYESPEWQANTFAGELLVPPFAIKGKSIEYITSTYNCSKEVAKIQLSL